MEQQDSDNEISLEVIKITDKLMFDDQEDTF